MTAQTVEEIYQEPWCRASVGYLYKSQHIWWINPLSSEMIALRGADRALYNKLAEYAFRKSSQLGPSMEAHRVSIERALTDCNPDHKFDYEQQLHSLTIMLEHPLAYLADAG
jgi:hypothetical protein